MARKGPRRGGKEERERSAGSRSESACVPRCYWTRPEDLYRATRGDGGLDGPGELTSLEIAGLDHY